MTFSHTSNNGPFLISTKKVVQVLVKKFTKKICFSCRLSVLYANFLIFYARMMENCPVVAMIPLLLPLVTGLGNDGVFHFLALRII